MKKLKLGETVIIEGVNIKAVPAEEGTDETNDCQGCYFGYAIGPDKGYCWFPPQEQAQICSEGIILKEVKE